MAHLIDKDALVAEIERIKNLCEKITLDLRNQENKDYYQGKAEAYKETIDLLDTLEVKEVDLEKAIDDYIYTHDGRKRLALELDWRYCNFTLKGGNEIIKFAKHFFELGVSCQVNNINMDEVKTAAKA